MLFDQIMIREALFKILLSREDVQKCAKLSIILNRVRYTINNGPLYNLENLIVVGSMIIKETRDELQLYPAGPNHLCFQNSFQNILKRR